MRQEVCGLDETRDKKKASQGSRPTHGACPAGPFRSEQVPQASGARVPARQIWGLMGDGQGWTVSEARLCSQEHLSPLVLNSLSQGHMKPASHPSDWAGC